MLGQIKKHLEKTVIMVMVATLLLMSAVSWGRILTQNNGNPEIAQVETNQTTNKIKRGMMVFTGMVIVVAEYIHLKDDK